MKITTDEEYKKVCKRVENGEKILKGKFLSNDPQIKSWVHTYNELALAMLDYEIDHDLLPI